MKRYVYLCLCTWMLQQQPLQVERAIPTRRPSESCIEFNLVLSTGEELHALLYCVYAYPMHQDAMDSTKGVFSPITRANCKRACQRDKPILQALTRDEHDKLHVSIDEASAHLEPGPRNTKYVRLLLAVFSPSSGEPAGASVSQQIHLVSNNDTPRGAGRLRIDCSVNLQQTPVRSRPSSSTRSSNDGEQHNGHTGPEDGPNDHQWDAQMNEAILQQHLFTPGFTAASMQQPLSHTERDEQIAASILIPSPNHVCMNSSNGQSKGGTLVPSSSSAFTPSPTLQTTRRGTMRQSAEARGWQSVAPSGLHHGMSRGQPVSATAASPVAVPHVGQGEDGLSQLAIFCAMDASEQQHDMKVRRMSHRSPDHNNMRMKRRSSTSLQLRSEEPHAKPLVPLEMVKGVQCYQQRQTCSAGTTSPQTERVNTPSSRQSDTPPAQATPSSVNANATPTRSQHAGQGHAATSAQRMHEPDSDVAERIKSEEDTRPVDENRRKARRSIGVQYEAIPSGWQHRSGQNERHLQVAPLEEDAVETKDGRVQDRYSEVLERIPRAELPQFLAFVQSQVQRFASKTGEEAAGQSQKAGLYASSQGRESEQR